MSDPLTEPLRRGDEWQIATAAATLGSGGIAARAVPPVAVGLHGEGDWTLLVRPEDAAEAERILDASSSGAAEAGAEGEIDAEVASTLASAGTIHRLARFLRFLGWSIAVLLLLLGVAAAAVMLFEALRGGTAGP